MKTFIEYSVTPLLSENTLGVSVQSQGKELYRQVVNISDSLIRKQLEALGWSDSKYVEVGEQFQDYDGDWYPFLTEQHKIATKEAGYKTRTIYIKEDK